jgi:glycogen debranching enzyme
MIKRYLAYLGSKADHHILSEGLGDWYDIGPKAPGISQNTPEGITATAIYYYDLRIAAHIAQILGKNSDVSNYNEFAKLVRQAFNKAFFNTETKQYGTGSQTANAMAVYMQLVEPKYKKAVIANIIKDIRDNGNSLTAGDIGYRYLVQVLENASRSDVIFDMNNRSDVPGYGYQLAKGATALTESWQARAAVSNDHLMLGHLMEWFYSGLGGIDAATDAIASNKIVIKPEPVGDVTYAKASYHSPYGVIATDWKKMDSQFELTVQIPANTSAEVYLPANKGDSIRQNGKPLNAYKELKFITYKNGWALIKAGSGTYHFVVTKR